AAGPGRGEPKADRVRLVTDAYVVSLRVRVLGLGAAPVVARVPRRRRRSAVDARALAAGAGIVVEGEGVPFTPGPLGASSVIPMVRWLVLWRMKKARPMARGWT